MFSANSSQVSTAANYIEDVFSTYLYTGNGSTQTINNGIDLSGKGGLVWMKERANDGLGNHYWFDTARGTSYSIQSNEIDGQSFRPGFTSFGATGFTLGTTSNFNNSATTYASWTFRKQPKFFDVVTYTGNGQGYFGTNLVSHSLASVPGCVMIKRTDSTGGWFVFTRQASDSYYYLLLNSTASGAGPYTGSSYGLTSTTIDVAKLNDIDTGNNINGASYVMYLFAHNAGGFGLTGTDNVISCGSYTGNGALNSINLGYEPQLVLIKPVSIGGNWEMYDTMRGLARYGDRPLYPNLSNAEGAPYPGDYLAPTATGFELNNNWSANTSGQTYIYIAIRRGPMKVPTDATKVFAPSNAVTTVPAWVSGFPVDLGIYQNKSGSATYAGFTQSRLQGQEYLVTNRTDAAAADSNAKFDYMNGYYAAAGVGSNYISWMWKRAPSFFDEVCYTGTGSATTVTHNLSVAPELMIVKRRDSANSWVVYTSTTTATDILILNQTDAKFTNSGYWNNTTPTSTVFTVGTSQAVNASAGTYVTYLFASCPGVSKVGSYTGTGTTQQINCGFAAGARFVLIKRTDSTGDWYVWDSARGIVAGNDPYLLLNSTAAEVTTTDYIDTYSAGFEISSTAPAAINASGGTFIYLAIA